MLTHYVYSTKDHFTPGRQPACCLQMTMQPVLYLWPSQLWKEDASPQLHLTRAKHSSMLEFCQAERGELLTAMAFLYLASDSAWLLFGHPADSHCM